jgi:hypothetical protein
MKKAALTRDAFLSAIFEFSNRLGYFASSILRSDDQRVNLTLGFSRSIAEFDIQ